MMLDDPVVLSPRGADVVRSRVAEPTPSEAADAASKLVNILPEQALAEYVLNLTAEQHARIHTERAGDALSQLVAAAATPAVPAVPTTPPRAPVAATNGHSAG